MRPNLSRLRALAFALLLGALLAAGCVSQLGSSAPASVSQTQTVAVESTSATGRLESTAASQSTETADVLASASAPATTPPAPAARDPHLYPDARLTPGDVLPVTAAQVSVPGYSSKARNVPVAEKQEVYAEYHVPYPQPTGTYECDHFIPLCLGGSNSIANLWPEPAPQFHWKDGLEVYLWNGVRRGDLSLAEAQREIRTDWYAYWVKAGKPGSSSDADNVAAQPAPGPVAKPSPDGLVVGWSVSGARYHYLTCRYFQQVNTANRRTGSVAQARAAGKTPCKACRPPE